MNEYLFSYGTLQKEKVQLETFGRLIQGSKDFLNGYTLSTIKIEDENVIAISEQEIHFLAQPSEIATDRIDGVIFEVTNEELLAADGYEPDAYSRVKMRFASGQEAWIYVAS